MVLRFLASTIFCLRLDLSSVTVLLFSNQVLGMLHEGKVRGFVSLLFRCVCFVYRSFASYIVLHKDELLTA
jgi:hypothetical protein